MSLPKPEMANLDEWKKTLKELSVKLPQEAIQRTKKAETKKAYDTDGYGYQFCIDRFNDVLGLYWGYSWKIENVTHGSYKSGAPFIEITVSIEIWIGSKEFTRGSAGGHTSGNYSDALKGAMTNAFKKAASFWGVGRDAYAATIDDDNTALPESDHERQAPAPQPQSTLGPDQKAKVKALPDSIRDWFRAELWQADEVYEKCSELKWDNEKIMEFIRSKGAK